MSEPSTTHRAAVPPAKPRLRSLGVWFGKLAGSVIFTMLLLEVGLRILGFRPLTEIPEQHDVSLLHPDPGIAEAQRNHWIHWPRETRRMDGVHEHARGYLEIRTNNCSFREDVDTEIEKRPGTTRVLVIGDSHTDGVCFNAESYPNLLEAEWNRRADSDRFEVINAGFGPSSPYQQLWAFQRVYGRFNPDHLIVAWYAGNDLVELLRSDERVHLKWDGSQFVHEAPTKSTDDTRSKPTTWGTVKATLRDRLALYHALVRIGVLRSLVRSAERDEYRERLESAIAVHSGPVWQGLNQSYYFTHHAESWKYALQMMEHILLQYQKYGREKGIGVTVMVIPTMRQIHADYDAGTLRETQAMLELSDEELTWDERACDALVELAQKNQVPVVDLRESLRKSVRDFPDRRLYYRFDHHLNVQGNRVAAEALDEALAERVFPAVP